ncbi:hypothetical protein SH2C18_41020 [Clostridium sediminicola]|uniref:rhomboid family intramembrane serine protease n=1 Tax=Clostridium sediminicola TaxID=3114879 RepID=UPI0031F25B35
MNWLNKLERKYGRYAIKNLMMYIVGLNAFTFLLMFMVPGGSSVVSKLALHPAYVLRGEVWRLVTFIFIPFTSNLIFIIFALYFYYLIGTTLEHQWGSFKFNMYYLIGMLGTIVASFVSNGWATNEYLNLSLFLAFAYLFPNFTVRLYFILPLKIKYLAYLTWGLFAIDLVSKPWSGKFAIIAAIINFFIFFGKDMYKDIKIKRQVYSNRKRFKSQMRKWHK